MKRLALLLLFPLACAAQSTSVSSTGVVDSDGFTWSAGTYAITFVPAPSWPSPNSYTWSGGNLQQNSVFNGSLNGSGAFTVSIPDNTAISPAGSKWKFYICPNASAGCFYINQAVSGSTYNITSLLNAALSPMPPRFAANPVAFGYGTVEVTPTPQPGSFLYNTTTGACEQYGLSGWGNCAGSGGTVTTGIKGEGAVYLTNTSIGPTGTFYTDPFTSTNTCGRAEALAACVAASLTSCRIVLSGPCSMTSAQTIAPTVSTTFDDQGFVTTCTQSTSGYCLTLNGSSASEAVSLVNGNFSGSGANGGGIEWESPGNGSQFQASIANFNNTANGAVGLYITGDSGQPFSANLQGNYNQFKGNFLTDTTGSLLMAMGGDPAKTSLTCNAISLFNSGGLTLNGFEESNFCTIANVIAGDGGAGSTLGNINFNMNFANNGDCTSASRLVNFDATSTQAISGVSFQGQLSAGGSVSTPCTSWGHLGDVFTITGTGASGTYLSNIKMDTTRTDTYAAFADSSFSGFAPFIGINNNDSISGASAFYGATAVPGKIVSTSLGPATAVQWTSGAGVPSANCGVGSIYSNTSAGSTSTALYLCYPANTWTAITVP